MKNNNKGAKMKTKKEKIDEFADYLLDSKACYTARGWARGKTAREAWHQCENPQWLLWWLAREPSIKQEKWVSLACKFARSVLKFVPKGEKRPLLAIIAAEKWVKHPTQKNRNAAARAANAAAAARAAAYAAAAYNAAAYNAATYNAAAYNAAANAAANAARAAYAAAAARAANAAAYATAAYNAAAYAAAYAAAADAAARARNAAYIAANAAASANAAARVVKIIHTEFKFPIIDKG
jgi:hypothetical protein